jgi:hypothetical protein
MNQCARVSEIEAARDGRVQLDGAHLASCAQCQAEMAALQHVSSGLRALRASTPVDRDALARARGVVMSSALVPHRSIRWRRLSVAAAVLVLGGAGALAAFKSSVPTRETRIQATDEGSAKWTIDSRDDSEAITLREGTLRLSVTRPPNGKHVIVHVPDGTIEDIGTVFHVVVSEGVTREVRVDQGAVRLTLAGFGVVELRAPERWSRSGIAPPVGSTPAAAIATPPEPVIAPVAQTPDVKPPRAVKQVRPLRVEPQATAGEDAAYLTVIRSVREGSTEQTTVAAKKYLEQYPNGFRAREVQSLLH